MADHDNLLEVEEATIEQLQASMTGGQFTARQLVETYLARIAAIDHAGPHLRSVLETNPDALQIAEALDRERAQGHVRGALHGIPILLKDNIDTADRMQTTAGSLALVDSRVAADALVASKLRTAGAVLLGKANLSEWANFRSNHSASGWSGRGRQTRNPFVLDRSPSGSSSGSAAAVSANLCAVTLGTETDGSIVSPSAACGVVGIKPTVGLTSRQGVIPISHTQDTVGPITRTVADAALVLSATADSGIDYSQYLDANGLRGARIGIARKFHTGFSDHADRVFEHALDVLRRSGAVLIDEVEIPGHAALRENFVAPAADTRSETLVMQYEFKADIQQYLATRSDAPVRTLADLIRFNEEHAAEEMPYFGQERFVESQARGQLTDDLYLLALEHNTVFGHGFAGLFEERRLDALVAPSNAPPSAIDVFNGDRSFGSSSTQAAAVSGFPLITVPAGFVADLLPLGLTFMGPSLSEPTLIRLAYAFEHTLSVRRAPRFFPTTLDLP